MGCWEEKKGWPTGNLIKIVNAIDLILHEIEKNVAKERIKDFEISRIDRFRHRTRYFTDSGIIGLKAFVAENYQRFKHLFHSKHEKKPKPVKGLDGIYSLKRLSEVICCSNIPLNYSAILTNGCPGIMNNQSAMLLIE